jgi:peptide/nickel transport system substrate-binding protein
MKRLDASLAWWRMAAGTALAAAYFALSTPAMAQSELLYGPEPDADRQGGSLTYGSLVEPPALDPFHQGADARIRVTTLLYQGLFYEGDDGPIPLLATGYEVSQDGLRYTFPLREGVTFHAGGPMTAADVKYSYDYIRDPDNGSPGAGDFNMVREINVIDDHTVEFVLSSPNASLPMTLGNKYGAVVPAGLFDDDGARAAMNETSFGTGPFTVREYQPNSYLELERFDGYWQQGLPYLDEITYLYLPNNAALLVALQNNRIDVAQLGRPQDAEQLEGNDNVVVQRWPSLEQKSLDLDSEYGPLQDVRVRQAISLAIDKDEILQAAIGGYGTVIHTVVAGMQDAWGVPVEELEYQGPDRERARELLEEAGVAGEVDIVLTTIAGYDWMDPAAVTLREQLADVGINMDIQRVDLGVWIDNFRSYNMGFTFNDWATQPDPNLLFFRHFHKRPDGADFRNWNNDVASDLLARGQQTADSQERQEIYREFQKELARTVPTVMLFSADHVTVTNQRVHNFYQHPTGWHFGLAKTQVE